MAGSVATLVVDDDALHDTSPAVKTRVRLAGAASSRGPGPGSVIKERFTTLDQSLVNDYERFARSFTLVRAADIKQQVEGLYASERFWPEPFFAPGLFSPTHNALRPTPEHLSFWPGARY